MVDLENFDGQEMLDKAQEKFNENQNSIYIALAIIAVVAGGIWWYTTNKTETNLTADNQVWKLNLNFAKDSFDRAINGGLANVANNFSGTDAGNIAKYRLGVSQLNLGNFDAAIDALEDVSFNDDLVGAVAKGALGDAYYEKGQFSNAISNYKDAVSHSKNDFTTPIYLNKLASVQEDNGNKSAALKTYEKLKENFPTSQQGIDADKHIARLSI